MARLGVTYCRRVDNIRYVWLGVRQLWTCRAVGRSAWCGYLNLARCVDSEEWMKRISGITYSPIDSRVSIHFEFHFYEVWLKAHLLVG